ncbi:class I SAM-dependent methyltransferase [bacterium]|nr:class I SAM-dependent methyltransferase [bacterium]
MDSIDLKQRELSNWTSVAPGWEKWDELLMRSAAPVAARLVTLAGIGPKHRVLDIASGTGEPALTIAAHVGPNGSVLATDFVEPMLAYAREKARRRGLANVVFDCLDGEALSVPPESFDAVTIRWGLMFMPDPVACLSHCREALKPGGRIAVACWAEPERNVWASTPAMIIREHLKLPAPPPDMPGIFAFGDGRRLASVLEKAGFTDVEIAEQPVQWGPFLSARQALGFLLDLAGPIAATLAKAPPDKLDAIHEDIVFAYEEYQTDGGVALPGVTWVASARRA